MVAASHKVSGGLVEEREIKVYSRGDIKAGVLAVATHRISFLSLNNYNGQINFVCMHPWVSPTILDLLFKLYFYCMLLTAS